VLHITVDEELVTRKLPGLPVAVRGEGVDAAKWRVAPTQVDITLTGTLLAVEKAKAAIVPVVKLGSGDGRAHDVDLAIEGLPPGIGVKISPERVRVTPQKPVP
jgi:YbbR domain-containing protein